MPKSTEKYKHCLDLTTKLDDLRKQKILCDVTLQAAEATFPAHRNVLAVSCPYFQKLFTSDMKEKNAQTISLKELEVRASAVDTLLTYLYTGNIDVTHFNAEELVVLADYLLIPEVKAMASEELETKVNVSNCLSYLDFAKRYNCERLVQASRLFLEKHFQEVTQSGDFLNLGVSEVIDIVSSDNIIVEKEEIVFTSIIDWIDHNGEEREIYFPELLTCVRWSSMSRKYIQNNVINNPLLQTHAHWKELVEKVLESQDSPDVLNAQKPRKCLQPAADVIIAVCGTQSRDTHPSTVRCYVPEENSWFEMQHFPYQINWHGLVEYQRELYTVGGERNGEVSDALEKFDFKTNSWINKSPMLKAVLFPAVASLGNYLYVIGASRVNRGTLQIYSPSLDSWTLGTQLNVPREITCAVSDGQFLYAIGGMRAGDGEYLNSVERYDPENDTWIDIPSMYQARGGSTAVCVGAASIFVIGGESNVRAALSSCEVYSTASNQWQSIASMHVPRYFAGAALVGKTIYVFGGVGGSNVTSEQRTLVDRYDIDKGEWKADISMPWAAKYFRCCSLRSKRDFLVGLPQVTN